MTVHVRYLVDDVERSIDFYTTNFGFTVLSNQAPAFADIQLGELRLLLSGPLSSAARKIASPCAEGSDSQTSWRTCGSSSRGTAWNGR